MNMKVGDKVKWNDPAISDYGEEIGVAKDRVFTSLEIDDEVALCTDGHTEVECYVSELEPIFNMRAVNIVWDTDGYVIEWLPCVVDIPLHIEEDRIADYLSNEYGFCVEGFEIDYIND